MKMMFFKQYLITLTFIVISVWVVPAATVINFPMLQTACANLIKLSGDYQLQGGNVDVPLTNILEEFKTAVKFNFETNQANPGQTHWMDFLCDEVINDDHNKKILLLLQISNLFEAYRNIRESGFRNQSIYIQMQRFCEANTENIPYAEFEFFFNRMFSKM